MAVAWSRQADKAIDHEILEMVIPASAPKAYKEGTRSAGKTSQRAGVNGTDIVQIGLLKKASYP